MHVQWYRPYALALVAHQKVKTIVPGFEISATGAGLPIVTTFAGVVSECTIDMPLHEEPMSVLRRVTISVGPPSPVHVIETA